MLVQGLSLTIYFLIWHVKCSYISDSEIFKKKKESFTL